MLFTGSRLVGLTLVPKTPTEADGMDVARDSQSLFTLMLLQVSHSDFSVLQFNYLGKEVEITRPGWN